MNRLLELPPEKQTPEQKKVFEQLVAGRGRILGPYKIWIHSPTIASGMEHIGTYLEQERLAVGARGRDRHPCDRAALGRRIRPGGPHQIGRQVGLSQEIIDAVLVGADPKLTDPHERAVHRFAAALVSGAKLRTPNSPRSRRPSAATASPRCWCCLATTPPSPSA